MKRFSLFLLTQILMLHLTAQQFALSNDKLNVVYLGVENPLRIVVENSPCNSIVVKVDNGTIIGENCHFIYKGTQVGPANILVYKKSGNQLKKIGEYAMRVKIFPPPLFKIGPYGGIYDLNDERKVQKAILQAQQFVRAELDNFDIHATFYIDSFSVRIFYNDSSCMHDFFNVTGKISQQLSDAFSLLKKDDIVIFTKIFAKGPDGYQWELAPLILTIGK